MVMIQCHERRQPEISYGDLRAYLSSRSQSDEQNYAFDLEGLDELYSDPKGDLSFAMILAIGLIEIDLGKGISNDRPMDSIRDRYAAARFFLEYDSNLTRLDGSRSGPVFLLDNAFAIADCLAAGRMNNAQVLRDQAAQLLDQRAYKAQELYAEDLERQKDPENYVYVIPQRLFVFVHELMGQRAGQEKQPWGKWDIIGDKEYIAAARAVYTQDMDKAAQVLCNLCNLHVQYSNPFPSGDNDDRLMGVEFDNPVRSLWPTEIFAWLRLRHEHGLALPQVEHPLLDQPLGRFDPSAIPKPDYEAWFTQLVGKLVEFNPRYADLPQLVFDDP